MGFIFVFVTKIYNFLISTIILYVEGSDGVVCK